MCMGHVRNRCPENQSAPVRRPITTQSYADKLKAAVPQVKQNQGPIDPPTKTTVLVHASAINVDAITADQSVQNKFPPNLPPDDSIHMSPGASSATHTEGKNDASNVDQTEEKEDDDDSISVASGTGEIGGSDDDDDENEVDMDQTKVKAGDTPSSAFDWSGIKSTVDPAAKSPDPEVMKSPPWPTSFQFGSMSSLPTPAQRPPVTASAKEKRVRTERHSKNATPYSKPQGKGSKDATVTDSSTKIAKDGFDPNGELD